MTENVMLLHSGGLSGRQWRRLIQSLGGYQVVAPDFLGCGAHHPWPADAPFHFQQDVDALVARLDEPVHLVGHSYGGFVALKLALQHPDLVRSLSVYDPVAFGVLYDAQDEVGLADLARAASLVHDDGPGGSEAWLEAFIDFWQGPGSWQALPAQSREAFQRVGRKVYLEVGSLSADRTGRAAYAALTVPTLVLVGERSPVAARQVGVWLTRWLPHASLQTIPEAGHMGPISHPELVNAAILGHLRQPSIR